jgi:carbamoyltransferase
MNILGIQGGVTVNQHDAAAALLVDGRLVCCVEEERLIRVKTATGVLPIESISACLKEAGFSIEDIDLVVLAGETYKDILERTGEWLKHHFGHVPKIKKINHQTAHLASAFYHSGFEQAMCLSYDAYGDGISGSMGIANKATGITVLETLPATNSLGVFYATMTSFLGFRPGEDEYKVMGLAPYGKANVDLTFFCRPASNGYISDVTYFRSRRTATTYEPYYSSKLIEKLGEPRRRGQPISEHFKNIAASTQETLEHCVASLVSHLHSLTDQRSLCLAGGVALNCSANRVLAKLPFIDHLFVEPASSDRGLALGCALYAAAAHGENIQPITHVFYGPSIQTEEIEKAIALSGMPADHVDDPASCAAGFLAQGKIIGWYQGRSEFGPRALGHRSILANPTVANMKDQINARVKFREEFRPFAPSVLDEKASELFDMRESSPYMTVAYDVRNPWNAKMPSTTHVNNTARVQTVSKESDPLFYELIRGVEQRTGCPSVLNTSFNIKGQPIVETPLDAISTFYGTGMDYLILGNYLISKFGTPRM